MQTHFKYIFIVVLMVLYCSVKAQSQSISDNSNFYYYKDNKIVLVQESNKLLLKLASNTNNKDFLLSLAKNNRFVAIDTTLLHIEGNVLDFVVLCSRNDDSIPYSEYISLKDNYNIISVQPLLEYRGNLQGIIDEFIVKLKPSTTYEEFQYLVQNNNCIVKEEDPFVGNQYIVSVPKTLKLNSMQMANLFYETNLFAFSEPNFVFFKAFQSVDTYFNDQWALKNTGQLDGTAGIDINVELAWTITSGSNIKVAVIDEGVDLSHPDLIANLLPGYDATGNNSGGAPVHDIESHGTACAGIIGAVKDNNQGIAGIAPSCKIIPIHASSVTSASVPETYLLSSHLVNSINWAWQNGADVISNSWVSFYAPVTSIINAINMATQFGRNGKGCVFAFSSGNSDTAVHYPARLPNVIAVGTISPCGERKSYTSCDTENWGSNYGEGLDVVVPGVLIPTTDRQGSYGYNPDHDIHHGWGGDLPVSEYGDQDYTIWFSGTSSACPHVAGVAALVLSANPNLTEQQVRDIIKSTARKVRTDLYSYTTTSGHPNGSWNNEMGYGLIDAYTAVKVAQCYDGGIITEGIIDSTTTWNSPMYIYDTIIIPAGVTLTITDVVKFTPNAKIIVKPNGKLILNGATLTNACAGEMWQGIELENAESGQSATLEMINSLIENAICAVKFVSDITKTSSKESTIIATNSTFKNNCIDIDIEKKTATYTTVASNFNTCNFIVDANYMGANTSTPNDHIHIKLYGTNSKNFRGCNFVGTSAWRGIVAEDAGFTVREKCTNPDEIISSPPCDLCADYTASSFSGFSKAIDVNNAGNQVAFVVKRTDFAANNTYRINVASSNNYKVTYSNFKFSVPNPTGKTMANYGIYSQNSSGYDISNNNFYQSSSILAGSNFGIVMRNSGTANNIIILNKFENLNTGLNVMQTNGSTSGTPSGLTFSCNNFTGNKYDISLSQNSTIKSNQGSSTSGANNSFVGTQTSSIYSGGSQLINYYHKNATPYIPYNPTTAYITPIATTSSPHLLACDYVQCLVAPKNALQQYQDLQNNNQNGSRDSEMTQLSNAAIHALMTDNVPHLDELKQWYSIINTPIAKYSLAETNFELKNYAEAENVLAEIPAMFEFGDKEQIEHNNYLNFHNFKKNLIDSERSYYDLTDAELSNLKQIAGTGNGRSATMAKGVLCFFYGICLEDEEENFKEAGEIFYAPAQQNSSPEEEIAEENNIVYPNPTNNFIYFDNFAKKSVSLHNSNGILLETTRESFMDLSKYSAGTYFLNINSKMVKVIKK